MRQGIEYLKAIKIVTNFQVATMLQNCRDINDAGGDCSHCPDRKECQKLYDDKFAEFNTYMTIELEKEKEIRKMMDTSGYNVLMKNLTTKSNGGKK